MFTTCLFCNHDLGANAVVEEFPVGRRLAFDAARGRLWAVCRRCERWNLSPIETRWEAIERCERLYRDTPRRVATDNIGLARLDEGLELVRIGEPLRPEFAAWRYGDQFGRRRRRAYLIGGGAILAAGGLVAGAAAAGLSIASFGGMWGQLPNLLRAMQVVRVRTPDGRNLKLRGSAIGSVRLAADPSSREPLLTFKHRGALEAFRGPDALSMAGKVIPGVNAGGGSRKAVQEAVRSIEAERGPEGFVQHYLASMAHVPARKAGLSQARGPTRLALEMALHEESERRAIEGELAVLEAAWAEAEEIAHIADNLFISPEVDERLSRLKGTRSP